jgi:hypothetical protein
MLAIACNSAPIHVKSLFPDTGEPLMPKFTMQLLLAFTTLIGVAAIPGCNFTTANISSFIVSKDKEGAQPADKFNPHETVYAKAVVSNVPSKVSVKWKVIAVKVEGEADNAPIKDLELSFDLASDGTTYYKLSPPANGIPAGTYKIEAHMLTESGDEKDLKTATITVAGE